MLTTSLSDHLAVGYGFDLAAPAALRAPPRRRTYLQERPAQDTEKAFHDLLEAQDLDGAWALASDVAENLLFEPASSRKVLRRSAEWQPVAPRSRPIAKRPNWMVLVVFAPYGVCCRSSSCATCGLETRRCIAGLRRLVFMSVLCSRSCRTCSVELPKLWQLSLALLTL